MLFMRMRRAVLLLCVVLCAPAAYSKSGLVELDEESFDKILNKFDAALVKFDVAYPYGSKHDAFVALAKEAREVDDVLVADVNVKDYGEKENAALAAKYGVTKDNFPSVKLFIKGKKDPITFDEKNGFTPEALRVFLWDSTGLLLSLPGCIRHLDLLSMKFVKIKPEMRPELLKEAEEAVKTLKDKNHVTGQYYVSVMKRIIEKGDSFVKTETERLKKILGGKVSEEKVKELEKKMNVLLSFQMVSPVMKKKEEL